MENARAENIRSHVLILVYRMRALKSFANTHESWCIFQEFLQNNRNHLPRISEDRYQRHQLHDDVSILDERRSPSLGGGPPPPSVERTSSVRSHRAVEKKEDSTSGQRDYGQSACRDIEGAPFDALGGVENFARPPRNHVLFRGGSRC